MGFYLEAVWLGRISGRDSQEMMGLLLRLRISWKY